MIVAILGPLILAIHMARASQYLLSQMRDRPLAFVGVEGPFGIRRMHVEELGASAEWPEFVETLHAPGPTTDGRWTFGNYAGLHPPETINLPGPTTGSRYVFCNNLATLLWLGQLGAVEFAPRASRVGLAPDGFSFVRQRGLEANIDGPILDRPDFLVFALTPHDETDASESALWLKELLDEIQLPSFVKTWGDGLHVYVPLLRQLDYASVLEVADDMAGLIIRAHGADITLDKHEAARTGKIHLDIGGNARETGLAAAFSPRWGQQLTISVPVSWRTLRGRPEFTVSATSKQLSARAQIWGDMLEEKIDLTQRIDEHPVELNEQIGRWYRIRRR